MLFISTTKNNDLYGFWFYGLSAEHLPFKECSMVQLHVEPHSCEWLS